LAHAELAQNKAKPSLTLSLSLVVVQAEEQADEAESFCVAGRGEGAVEEGLAV
jgi:hypothetical protein